ncbi:MAG: ABC transporter ATP-binding protein [Deltaproteobacteria bacterium]|nr:ABC transporter ATP-binding protein [Deltaproteobacteria bacterium]MBI4196203.1 ABC transporter ATP-binding protein [Deltaproteobacteria bacterium]
MIVATSITKKFGPFTALKEISFRIEAGEVVGLLGPNGAGKTTTMRILTGFMPPTSGEVTIKGINLLENPIEAKKRIGYLPETPPLYPELTVEESLRFIAELHRLQSPEKKIAETLAKTGIQDVRHRLVQHLSKGYRQRVGIAQAILHEPDVLILDEPTIGLDPKQIIEIRELIKNLRGRQAIIFSSHILQEVSAVCDRVIILNQGSIVADGKVSELTKASLERRYLVTATRTDDAFKSSLEKLPGVTEVKEHHFGLEEIFLQITENNSVAPDQKRY